LTALSLLPGLAALRAALRLREALLLKEGLFAGGEDERVPAIGARQITIFELLLSHFLNPLLYELKGS
jgi:hypothetical protein